MADERAVALPKGCDWPTLRDQTGTALLDYTDTRSQTSRPCVAAISP
jgi:hypothetical protein